MLPPYKIFHFCRPTERGLKALEAPRRYTFKRIKKESSFFHFFKMIKKNEKEYCFTKKSSLLKGKLTKAYKSVFQKYLNIDFFGYFSIGMFQL